VLTSHPHAELSRIIRALAASAPAPAPRDEPFHEAAVALVLHPVGDGLEALFIKRATREGDPWSGQIALPGGRREVDEPDLLVTAIRETYEEIGVDLATDGVLLGELDELRPRSPLLPPVVVRPFVFAVAERPTFVLSEEVAEVFWTPLCEVFDPERKQEITVHFPGINMTRPAIGVGEHVIWGMTEHILRTFEGHWR
jgi:8-oxo-dGTP pyrophosphatase MutT (NUDIX family)